MSRYSMGMICSGVLLVVSAVVLSGCYTIEGAGRDVEAAGAGVAAGAEKTREYSRTRPAPGSNNAQFYGR